MKGCFWISNNSLGSAAYSSLIPELYPAAGVGMLSPVSSELDPLRQSLILNGLQAIAYNLNRRNSYLKLYEFGRIYERDGSGYREQKRLVLFVSGRKTPDMWNSNDQKADIDRKSVV